LSSSAHGYEPIHPHEEEIKARIVMQIRRTSLSMLNQPRGGGQDMKHTEGKRVLAGIGEQETPAIRIKTVEIAVILSIHDPPTRGAILVAEIVGTLMSIAGAFHSKIRKEDLLEICGIFLKISLTPLIRGNPRPRMERIIWEL
jgi:hypothetical protein